MQRARRVAAALGLVLLAGSLGPGGIARPAAAAAADFPPTHAAYHTYSELTAEIHAVEAAHPDIVSIFSIGKSSQGRELWAAKISDNVAVDEPEPEVLFDGLHHGLEHLSLEMTIAILHWLADGYGTDPTVTSLVNKREVWIIFGVNPDGAEYDITGSPWRHWRKNRQPTPGSRYIGTDLNRNYGYRWGCCGGSTANPAGSTFRGRSAWSAPEVRAVRDFVNSRVVDGRQQIRAAITFHTSGEQILWPYGYTRTDVPPDMSLDDWRTLVAMARSMAGTNGYTAMQSSSLYITDGDEIDWLYGVHRIFAYTFELYPAHAADFATEPPSGAIAPQTLRNRRAVIYLISRAGCPYDAVGLGTLNCGAFFDDFEIARGWRVNPYGTDTATQGAWQRANPAPTYLYRLKQAGTVPTGSKALVTGAAAGTSVRANDLDGGITTVLSPQIAIPDAAGQRLSFHWTFAHGADSSTADYLQVTILAPGGARDVLLARGSAVNLNAVWRTRSVSLDAYRGQTIQVRIRAADRGRESLVEAAVDDVRVTRPD